LAGSTQRRVDKRLFTPNEYYDGIGPKLPLTIYNANACKEPPLKGGFNEHIS